MINISNVFVNLKVRTSKLENKIFQLILEEIKKNIENLSQNLLKTIDIEIEKFELEESEIELGLDGLMNKGIELNYMEDGIVNKVVFNYISSYKKDIKYFSISISPYLLNCFKKNTIEYIISLRTFFYLRKKSLISFFNLLIKNIEKDKSITVSLDELKKIFKISDEAYDRFFDFEKNILKPLIEKINLYSNFILEYEKIKKGENKNNKVIGIKFNVHNIVKERNIGETNYLTQIIKNMIIDYQGIWEEINEAILKYGFESTKRNIIFLKENKFEISDNEIKNYIKNDGRNIEEILKISDHILIKEKYCICKDIPNFIKNIYDVIIGFDFYYSLNFKFLSIIKNYKEGETLYYKDSTYVIYGKYKNNKGFFKIFESKEKI